MTRRLPFTVALPCNVSFGSSDLNTELRKPLNGGNLDLGSLNPDLKRRKILI
jgi:hypothetical protein